MDTDKPATPESEPLGFRTLLNRLNSAMHRLKVAADSFGDDAPEKYRRRPKPRRRCNHEQRHG
jgi:hypothetical protein